MNSLRFFWLAVFALLIGIASFLAEEIFFPIRLFQSNSLEYQIHDDLRKLREQKSLPAEIQNIHEVFILDQRLEKAPINWQDLSIHDFPQNPAGQYDLQIEIFDTQTSAASSKDNGQIIQYSLFEKESKNKIWELNREYSPTDNTKKK